MEYMRENDNLLFDIWSIYRFKKIKESVEASVTLREGGYRAKVNIHMGTCGIASGARQIMTTVMDEISKAGRQRCDCDHLGVCRSVQP
jgi:hypothetical protein